MGDRSSVARFTARAPRGWNRASLRRLSGGVLSRSLTASCHTPVHSRAGSPMAGYDSMASWFSVPPGEVSLSRMPNR